MPEYFFWGIFGAVWFMVWLFCMLCAYIPGDARISRRTRARLILTAWFFPLAIPVWILCGFYWLLAVGIEELGYLLNDAFSTEEG